MVKYMKNIKEKIILSILMCILMIGCIVSIPVFAKENSSKKFEYSIRPGTEEWGKLNHGERVLTSQIPQEILENMNTEDLVTAVLDYPCFLDMMFYDTHQQGFEVLREHFNGMQELFSRKDVATCLLNEYRKQSIMELVNIKNKDEQFNKSLELTYLETMLAQPEITQKFSDNEINELTYLTNKNYKLQLENKDFISSISFSGYYESLAEQQDIELYNYGSTVTTPNGSKVDVIIRTDANLEYYDSENIKRTIETNYPGATVVGGATNRYNCHAYAWANSQYVWMNDPSLYWNDGSYKLKAKNSPTQIGQKIYYPGTHSGNVIGLSGNMIRSKWGPLSLVEHSVENCPYFFIPLVVRFYGR